MSSESVIHVDGLTKSFPLDARPHRYLLNMLRRRSRRSDQPVFTALHDINLNIRKGETVGVLGRNGSGKSTLLQLICGTLSPDCGRVVVRGKVAALLELGAGFNPEFTGRENVYLGAALGGMSAREVAEKLPSIIAFAEIGDFIDRPVKTYSSGMYVRLAFAVAISADPDILIVDEALSVGDEAFQRKCFARIEQMREAGATVLFVSHSASAITDLCDRAVLLDNGDLLGDGKPKEVVAWYQRLLYAPADRTPALREMIRHRLNALVPADTAPGQAGQGDSALSLHVPIATDDELPAIEAHWDEGLRPNGTIEYERLGARIHDIRLEDLYGNPVNVLVAGREYVYSFGVQVEEDLHRARFGMLMRTVTGIGLAGASTHPKGGGDDRCKGERLRITFNFRCLLGSGVYFLNAGALASMDGEETFVDRRIDVMMFRVLPDNDRLSTALVDLEFSSAIGVQA